MTEPENKLHLVPDAPDATAQGPEVVEPGHSVIDATAKVVQGAVGAVVSLADFKKRRENPAYLFESREISPNALTINEFFNLLDPDDPNETLHARALGGQSLILSIEEIRRIGHLTLRLNSGETLFIDTDSLPKDMPDDTLVIIRPEDFE